MFARFGDAILSWLAFLASLCVFLLLLPGLISMHYHPLAPGIHLVPVRIGLAGIGVLACFILALRHTTTRRRPDVLRNLGEILAVPVVLCAVFYVTAGVYQQPGHLTLTYKGDTYAIPRVYKPHQPSAKAAYESMIIAVCSDGDTPVYASRCSTEHYVELGTRPITAQFTAHYALDTAEVTYSADVIDAAGPLAEYLPDGSFHLRQGGGRARFLLDETGRIDRFAHCYVVTGNCTVSARTQYGILRFPAHADDAGANDFWRDAERRWTGVFDGWKCVEPDCASRGG